ncbi:MULTISPECIES: hypothetical protein [Pseudomonas]|jgi:hypothetical protein|uniref:Uncharacterized protein n=2 Tax=Pseudomonas TaxID=286 RepID=A0A1W6QYL1_PSEPU|nr:MULTISPECIES: hypothetical protein [Pseudomonas]ARO46393.1 Hypothetical protein [Pseudomonas putida]AYN19024.1 hypothetical protein CHR29_28365 [Pseudomonas monteilii]MCE1038022.1 hypothetical protein [Pseudomonas monteilii]MCL8328793.1 hypothetical protein [Pseudomonas juntendi]MDD2012228.1 hypothetical protein [Pseudomonas putida]
MITNQTQPLEISARVLSQQTLASIRQSPSFSLQGWKILDRWALNNPERLKSLELQGELQLLSRLLDQQALELTAINSLPVESKQGLTEHEILAMLEIETDL